MKENSLSEENWNKWWQSTFYWSFLKECLLDSSQIHSGPDPEDIYHYRNNLKSKSPLSARVHFLLPLKYSTWRCSRKHLRRWRRWRRWRNPEQRKTAWMSMEQPLQVQHFGQDLIMLLDFYHNKFETHAHNMSFNLTMNLESRLLENRAPSKY